MIESNPLTETVSGDGDQSPVAEGVALPGVTVEEVKELIVARGRERGGFVTSEDIAEGMPVEDLTPEQVEDFLTQIEEHLRSEGIEVIEVPGEELEAEGETIGIRLPRDEDLLKAPTNDPVRMYLKAIGSEVGQACRQLRHLHQQLQRLELDLFLWTEP